MTEKLPRTIVLLLILSLLAVNITISAGAEGTYSSTASIFTIGNGARPLGMGSAFVGLADGGNALIYNPAGLAFFEETNLTSFCTKKYGALDYGSIEYAQQNWGLSYLQLSSGNIYKKDPYGNPTGRFNYTSRGVVGAYAQRIGNLSLALQGRVFNMANPGSALGYSLSPSFLYRVKPFQLGGIFKNLLSTDISYTEEYSEPWQKKITLGIAYSTENLNLDLDVEALLKNQGIDLGVSRIGAESKIFSNTFLRAGVTSTLQASLGLGVRAKGWQIDYSYQFHEELPSSLRLSLTARFG